MKKIIAITCQDDFHTKSVKEALFKNNVDLICLERENYAKDWILSSTNMSNQTKIYLETKNEIISHDKINSIWNRRDFVVKSDGHNEDPEQNYINTQRSIHVNAIMRYLALTIPSMNNPYSNWACNSKLHQLEIARNIGFLIPDTYQGGSPDIADEYLSLNKDNKICIKALEAIHIKYSEKTMAHYTSLFKHRPKSELSSLRECPVVLQNFIDKDYEIRATVVGNKVFAASIDTKNASEDAKIDWRHYDWANTPYREIRLPKDIEEKLIKVNQKLGLVYGAFDLIKSIQGDYYFLEVNSQGQWLWVEDLTGMPISEEIAYWLINKENTKS